MEIVVINHSGRGLRDTVIEKTTNLAVEYLEKNLDFPFRESLSIVFVNPTRMKELNYQFRGKNELTDVLSFSGEEEDSLGELVFNVETMEEQAGENQHSLYHEYLYLVLHGILHLLGYDHEKAVDAKKMYAIQDKAFEELYFNVSDI